MENKNLKAGLFFAYLYNVINLIVSLFCVPLLTKAIGQSEYGLYGIVGAFFSYITIFENCFSVGTLKFYCEALNKNSKEEMENTLGICQRMYRILSFVIILIAIIFIFIFNVFYKGSLSTNELMEGSWMLVLLFVGIIITMNNSLYNAGIQAYERFIFLNIIDTLNRVLQIVLYIVFIYKLPYAITIVLIQLFINTLCAILRKIYAKNKLDIKVKVIRDDKKLEKEIMLFSLGIVVAQIAYQIFWRTDQVILAKYYNTSMVAVYSVASSLYMIYMNVGKSTASVFFPRISKYYNEDNASKDISDTFIKVGRISLYICLLILTGFILFGKEFLYLWAGEDYLDAYLWAIIVMVPLTIEICQTIGESILQVMDKYAFRSKLYFLSAILNVILTIILSNKLGPKGASIATGISLVLTSGLVLNIYYKKEANLDVVSYWKNFILILLKNIPIFLGSYYLLDILKIETGIINLIIQIIIYTLVFVLYNYLLIMDNYEKGMVNKLIKKFIKKKD